MDHLKHLGCLYLRNNKIARIDNLQSLSMLHTLSLCNNLIRKIDNLSCLPNLNTLYISVNKLRSKDDVADLQYCKQLSVLDISNNQLEDDDVITIFGSIPCLKVLEVAGNPFLSRIGNFRFKIIEHCKSLLYVNKRPISDTERQNVTESQVSINDVEEKLANINLE